MTSNGEAGVLYVVATPIGNLKDFTQRAVDILAKVDLIAAEDTRHSRRLLAEYGINTPCVAVHEHNERQQCEALVGRLRAGQSIALISDAGTPLISDPGFTLVRQARNEQITVVPIPGANAAIAALSVAGLPCDRFSFEGFLPAKSAARIRCLEALMAEPRTLIFYESPHRIVDCLTDMLQVFGAERQVVLARELTKLYETVQGDRMDNLLDWVKQDSQQQKGEMVILIAAAIPQQDALDANTEKWLRLLLHEIPMSRAAALVAEMTGLAKKQVYDAALRLTAEGKAGEQEG